MSFGWQGKRSGQPQGKSGNGRSDAFSKDGIRRLHPNPKSDLPSCLCFPPL